MLINPTDPIYYLRWQNAKSYGIAYGKTPWAGRVCWWSVALKTHNCGRRKRRSHTHYSLMFQQYRVCVGREKKKQNNSSWRTRNPAPLYFWPHVQIQEYPSRATEQKLYLQPAWCCITNSFVKVGECFTGMGMQCRSLVEGKWPSAVQQKDSFWATVNEVCLDCSLWDWKQHHHTFDRDHSMLTDVSQHAFKEPWPVFSDTHWTVLATG